MLPSGSIQALTPVSAARSTVRWFSAARKRAARRCCQGAARVAVPGVVGEGHERGGSFAHERGHLGREGDLEADREPERDRAEAQQRDAIAGREAAGVAGQRTDERQHLLERDVLAERHQVPLVVVAWRLPPRSTRNAAL